MKSIAALAALLLAAAGCTTHPDGPVPTASSAPQTASATATAAGPPIVAASAIKSMLLKRSELGAIIGDTDVAELFSFTEPNDATTPFDPFPCAYRALAGSSIGY